MARLKHHLVFSAPICGAHSITGPRNTTPMMAGRGPYGLMEMGGMFITLKVCDDLARYDDPGWYRAPAGTVAWRVS